MGLFIEWSGEGLDEKGYVDDCLVVEVSPEFFRPAEVATLCGDATKARELLHWRPRTSFKALVKLMVEAELEVLKKA